jgi:hypothetical protein
MLMIVFPPGAGIDLIVNPGTTKKIKMNSRVSGKPCDTCISPACILVSWKKMAGN